MQPAGKQTGAPGGYVEDQDRPDRFKFEQTRGPLAVGLRVIEQYDHSRVFAPKRDPLGRLNTRERARPLQTLMWYPALPQGEPDPVGEEHGGSQSEADVHSENQAPTETQPAAEAQAESAMRVRDYLALWTSEVDFECTTPPREAEEWAQALAPALNDRLWAVRGATEAAGPFPLVIYAPSFSSRAWENADLCEYLASCGYVVLATPSLGARTRAMTMDGAGLFTQAQDIAFLMGFARSLPQVDTGRVAVAGFSWGGLANVFAADADDRIGALVALDGSLRYWPGLVQAAGIKPETIGIPLLSIAQGEWTLEDRDRFVDPAQLEGPNVLNAWGGALFNMRMLGMTHRQFSTMGQRNEDYWRDVADPDFLDRQKADYDRADAETGYAWICRYVRAFLDHALSGSEAAKDFLNRSPRENGVPRHLISLEIAKSKSAAPTLAALRERIAAEGFDFLAQLGDSSASDGASLAALGDPAALEWVDDLLRIGAAGQARLLLNAVRQHSALSAKQLAIASRLHGRCGQYDQARQALDKAARLGPYDPGIRRGLGDLPSGS